MAGGVVQMALRVEHEALAAAAQTERHQAMQPAHIRNEIHGCSNESRPALPPAVPETCRSTETAPAWACAGSCAAWSLETGLEESWPH
jgi:hypothetical protein